MDPLARAPSCVCLVSKSSNSVRSLVKPALHVGEQISGGVGCRAWGGSGGISGAATTTGGSEGGDLLAQPLASSSIGSSISASLRQAVFGVMGGLQGVVQAPGALFAGGLGGLAGGALERLQLGGVGGAGVGVGGLLRGEPPRLHAGGHHGGDQRPGEQRGQQALGDGGGDHAASAMWAASRVRAMALATSHLRSW